MTDPLGTVEQIRRIEFALQAALEMLSKANREIVDLRVANLMLAEDINGMSKRLAVYEKQQ